MTTINHVSTLWDQERRQYRLIFWVTFMILLIITPFARLLPNHWRPWPAASGRHLSLVAEARAVTQRVLAFAFL